MYHLRPCGSPTAGSPHARQATTWSTSTSHSVKREELAGSLQRCRPLCTLRRCPCRPVALKPDDSVFPGSFHYRGTCAIAAVFGPRPPSHKEASKHGNIENIFTAPPSRAFLEDDDGASVTPTLDEPRPARSQNTGFAPNSPPASPTKQRQLIHPTRRLLAPPLDSLWALSGLSARPAHHMSPFHPCCFKFSMPSSSLPASQPSRPLASRLTGPEAAG